MEGAVIRRTREPSESNCCPQKLAALVEHALLDHLVGPPEHQRRNREAEGLRRLQVDDESKAVGLLDGQIRRRP